MTYDLRLSPAARSFYDKADDKLAKRLNRCFSQIQTDPRGHPNIRILRGKLAGYYRYRLGSLRIIYQIHEDHRLITIVVIVQRGQAYA